MRQIVFLLLSCFLSSCSQYYTPKYGANAWLFEKTEFCPTSYRTAHLYYPPPYLCGCMSLEMVRDNTGLRTYINLLLIPVCPENPDTLKRNIELIIDSQPYSASVTVLEGGQRLLLDDLSSEFLLDALWKGQIVTLRVGMHCQDITPHQFRQAYRQMACEK